MSFITDYLSSVKERIIKIYKGVPIVSAESLGILGIMVLHSTTIPALLSLITATSDILPTIDIVIFVWGGLLLLFVRSFILKDMVGILTNFTGFFIQACLLGFLLFK
jgi:hypothetical protein